MNIAYPLEYRLVENGKEEMLNGKIYRMARPSSAHAAAAGNIHGIFWSHLKKGGRCRVMFEPNLYLSETDRFEPDIVVVCNPEFIGTDGVYGPPDLVVEVISPSTRKRDKGYKKDAYEKYGVKEYWIVEVSSRSIEIFLLIDGKYRLANTFVPLQDWEIKLMSEEARAEIEYEFKSQLFDDLIFDIREIFED
ncbi:MAG: Uma2 family endonuclease [Clostridiales bacterium]|jgi:Uma2 family endonuclease|nr:Uma2 family endonuclease [Clostridiales bacterium]